MAVQNQTEVVIIGAGLTGLTTALYLKKAGISFVILEKDSKVGGVIQSYTEEGFQYESGPNTGVLGNPEVAELFEELGDLCELETADPEAKRRLIWKKGKWHALPSGPWSAITTPLFKLSDKLRVLGEPFRKKGDNPLETVADMIKRRLGKSFLNYAINPFISGIYAGAPEKLVTKYALPKMYNLEYQYGSMIKGGIKKSKANKLDPRNAKATREVFSVKDGLHQMILALKETVGEENIILNANDSTINKANKQYTTKYQIDNKVVEITSNYVVTTTGAYTLPSLLPFLKSKLDNITNLYYAKVSLVVLGYKDWNGIPINAFGGLIPAIENKNMLGILFTSSFLKNRAPEGGALLSCFIGGTRYPSTIEMSDEELSELVLANVKEMMETNQEPDLLKIHRYPHAIAQYEASTKERLEAIEDIENEYEGLILAGNIRDGIGMADRIKQGRTIAEEISKAKA